MTTTLNAPPPVVTTHAHLSQKQLSLFWKLFARAWARHAYLAEIHQNDNTIKAMWRHHLIYKATDGKTDSIKKVRNADYEALMLALSIEADLESEIGYWTSCIERRYRHLIQQILRECAKLDGSIKYNWDYVRSTYKQSGLLPASMDDAPADTLRKVFQMLDSHRRRLDRRRRENLEEAPF